MYFLNLVCRAIVNAKRTKLLRTRLSRHRVFLWPAGACLVLGTSLAAAQTAFSDVTNAVGMTHSSETYGASWGDVNGDGFPDLFVSNHRTMKSLFLNKGNGTFVDIASQTQNWQNRPGADTHGASWADFNNNGTQDLLVSVGTGNPSEWFINDNQKLVYSTIGSGLDLANLGGRLPVWLDYDNDHRLDVVVAQYGGVAKLFHQNSDGTFSELGSSANLHCKRFHYAQLVDVNNDGRLEVLCPDEATFPQKIYDTSTFPWKKLFDSEHPVPWVFLVAMRGAASTMVPFASIR